MADDSQTGFSKHSQRQYGVLMEMLNIMRGAAGAAAQRRLGSFGGDDDSAGGPAPDGSGGGDSGGGGGVRILTQPMREFERRLERITGPDDTITERISQIYREKGLIGYTGQTFDMPDGSRPYRGGEKDSIPGPAQRLGLPGPASPQGGLIVPPGQSGTSGGGSWVPGRPDPPEVANGEGGGSGGGKKGRGGGFGADARRAAISAGTAATAVAAFAGGDGSTYGNYEANARQQASSHGFVHKAISSIFVGGRILSLFKSGARRTGSGFGG